MKIAVFLGSRLGNRPLYRETAEKTGEWIARSGHSLIYGGEAMGLMGVLADRALEGGASVTGVVPDIPLLKEQRHPGLTEYIPVKDMAERKKAMLDRADLFLCLPGGMGTLDEFTDVMVSVQLGLFQKPCVLFDAGGYYRAFGAFLEQMAEEGFLDRGLLEAVTITEDFSEIDALIAGREEKAAKEAEEKALIREIGRSFGLSGEPEKITPITAGLINRTLRVSFGGREYIFQTINSNVFRDPRSLMENIGLVTRHLEKKRREGSYPAGTLHFYPAGDGSLCLEKDGCFWRVCDYIPSVTPDKLPGEEAVRRVGEAFGQFQAALSDLDGRLLRETIPAFHDTAARLRHLFASADVDSLGRRAEAAEELAAFAAVRDKAAALSEAFAGGAFPVRVTHNDTKTNNILLDPESGATKAVIDLDTVMPGFAPYDFADAVRYLANTAAEDEPDLSKVALDLGRFTALAEGFVPQVRGAWTKEELEALPLAAFSLTVETAARFLDDYLTGDTYFRTEYPGHNLVRARSQLALARSMMRQGEAMEEVIRRLAADEKEG